MSFPIPVPPPEKIPSGPLADQQSTDPCVVGSGGCDPLLDDCAKAMGGQDPATAYAAAMLWYQGYPDPPHPAV